MHIGCVTLGDYWNGGGDGRRLGGAKIGGSPRGGVGGGGGGTIGRTGSDAFDPFATLSAIALSKQQPPYANQPHQAVTASPSQFQPFGGGPGAVSGGHQLQPPPSLLQPAGSGCGSGSGSGVTVISGGGMGAAPPLGMNAGVNIGMNSGWAASWSPTPVQQSEVSNLKPTTNGDNSLI